MNKRNMTLAEKQEYFRAMGGAHKQPSTVAQISRKGCAESDDASVVAATPPVVAAPEGGPAQTRLDKMAEQDEKPPPQSAQERAAEAVQEISAMFLQFRDDQDNFYIEQGGNAVMIGTSHCADIVRTTYIKAYGRTLSKDMLDQVLTVLRQTARALRARAVYQRVGKDGDAYLIDLGDPARRCARVDAQGVTFVSCASTEAIFRRGNGYGELPDPIMPSDAAEAWEFAQPLLQGINARDRLPLIAAKVEHMRCDSPHPILVFLGPKGSGKTSAARRSMLAVDPFKGDPPSVLADEQAINAAAQSRHSLLLDNIGEALGGEIENTLCRSAYGAKTTVRELYTTADSRTLVLHAAWHLSGITPFIRQADTLERALVMRVSKAAGGFRPEAAIREEYAAQLPRVFGALLWFLSERMRYAASIGHDSAAERMVDWATTGEAIGQAIGQAPGGYALARQEARRAAARDWIEGDSFASALLAVLTALVHTAQSAVSLPGFRSWSAARAWAGIVNGRPTVLMTAAEICDRIPKKWPFTPSAPHPPSNPRQTRGALERVQGEIQQAGWGMVCKQTTTGSNSYWAFQPPR